MKPSNALLLACILAWSGYAPAQTQDYSYMRAVTGVDKEGWYSIALPPEIFGRLKRDFTDIRIYSLTGKDTLEVPYLLHIKQDDIVRHAFNLPVINRTKKGRKQYLTFESTEEQTVNHLDLSFREKNFHALVSLEGSHDLKEWFAIADNLRIASVQNNAIDFRHTTLSFPDSRFRFLRVAITPDVALVLRDAVITYQQVKKEPYNRVAAQWATRQNEDRQTIVTLKLDHKVPVSRLRIHVNSRHDFYRLFSIDGVRDSIETQTGWVKLYDQLYRGHITSLQADEFNFTWQPVQELKLTIHNEDNPPLEIDSIGVYYPTAELIALIKPGDNQLFYGNTPAQKPSYDLVYFEEKIPAQKQQARLGDEKEVPSSETIAPPALTSKLWLWAALFIAVSVLGYFTFRMINQQQAK